MNWHEMQVDGVLAALQSNASVGLSADEAARRLAQYGQNELKERGARPPWRILLEQFAATMVIILIGAALLSALLGEYKDAIAIGAIVVLFAALGFVQEYRAEQAMAALRRLAAPRVRLLRDGQIQEMPARELVPGDILFLEAGNLVPADIRILECHNLRIQEAALTGESEAIEKAAEPLAGADLPLGDRRNMAFAGTLVVYGRGKGVVVSTGMRTELGKIADLLQEVGGEQTPLQKRLDRLGKSLALVGATVAGLIFLLGWLRGDDLRHMLLTSVSVAVAIIPEGLPAVVTITLALGAQRMLRRRALIRKLPAVETLGSVTVICSDKTGTLTENRMTVTILDVAGQQINLRESMINRMPALEAGEVQPALPSTTSPSVGLLLTGMVLCNDAELKPSAREGRFETFGDPTEGALLVAAAQMGLRREQLTPILPRLAEIPFDSERKRMTTIHAANGNLSQFPHALARIYSPDWRIMAFTKGAVDGLLDISDRVWVDERPEPISANWLERIRAANDRLAQQGMRILGLAIRPFPQMPQERSAAAIERDLIFVGLIGMIDPPRPEVREAVTTARNAGVRPVMITGDHPLTAFQIASELGIVASGGDQTHVLTGQELASLSDGDLAQQVERVAVFARVSPEHKLRIINALQQRGHIVAMTGDGVNDAPALRRADIGVAMGITGADVAKEAADMVLQDDNFATIVSAIEEGRTIFDNLRKFIKYSLAGNIGKVSVMLLAPFLGKPLPLLPLQLLWLNLLTDGLLGLGLGLEPPEKDVMQRPPVSPRQGIFSRALSFHVIWVGMLIGVLALGVGYLYWRANPEGVWQTMVFSTLAFSQLAQALASRSGRDSLLRIGITSNLPGMILAGSVFLLQVAVIYLPFLQTFFKTKALSLPDLALSLALGALVFVAIELEKWWLRRQSAALRV